MYALLRSTDYFTGVEGKDFIKRIGKVRYIFRYLRGYSAGTWSSTQLFRYAGVSRAYEEGRADWVAARTWEIAGYCYRGQEGDNRPTVRRIQASVWAISARGRPVLGMGSHSEAARRCGEYLKLLKVQKWKSVLFDMSFVKRFKKCLNRW